MQRFLSTNGAARNNAAYRADLLDVTPTHELDDLAFLAAQICQTPIALITFLDAEGQRFISQIGWTATNTLATLALCTLTIQQGSLLIVPDTQTDSRFVQKAFVVGEPYLRFYAGVPLIAPDGKMVGTLCVIDLAPHEVSLQQQQALQALSRQAVMQLEWRRHSTERKQAEEALRKTHELYRRAIAAADAVPYQRDYKTDTFVFMGEGIQQISGYTAAEMTPDLIDRICSDTIMRGDTEGLTKAAAIERTRLGEFHRWRCDSRLHTKTGEGRWIADASVEIYDETGKPTGSIGILMDITDRKQNEVDLQETNDRLANALAELQRAQQHLVQQERLRALGTMASGIAHDFNNLLAPILGYTELLLLRPESWRNQAKVTHYLEAILAAAQSASQVVGRLREFYRYREEREPAMPVDLPKVVEQALLLTQPHWKDQALARGLRVHVESQLQAVPLITGNSAELQELLTNLILNAMDALVIEGKITIRLFMERALPERTATEPATPHVVLEVSDTGVGMDAETRRRCFEPFYSTKGKRGTGLGLAVVYGIVQRHGGRIAVESKVGEGTTFRIHLPIPHQLPELRQQPRVEAGPSLHILVVDDEPTVRDVVVEYLQHAGHSIVTASQGTEGLAKFQAAHFDLVITDRAMPQLNGDGLAAAIKDMSAHTPVILLTGFGEFMNAAGELPHGVDAVMSKPLAFDSLQHTIAQVLKKPQ
ncbi:MAG: ATP-binding protein [Caldilineaceae bacterium]